MAQNIKPSEISEVLLQQLREVDTTLQWEEVGKVLQVSDGVVRLYGLTHTLKSLSMPALCCSS